MFERLLELLLQAKSGAIAVVFVLGTTGALVTATVSNGVTTITIAQESASPSASASASPTASPTASASASPTASPTASPSASPSSSPSSSPSASDDGNCSEWAHERNAAVKTVNDAYSRFHTDLQKLRKDAKGEDAREIVQEADQTLKDLRQAAVKLIHESGTCDKDDDEDEDEDEDEDGKGNENWLVKFLTRLFGGPVTVTVVTTSQSPSPSASASPSASPTAGPSASPSASPSPSATPVVTGDPQQIAEDAVAAMQLVFDTAKADLEALGDTEESSSRGGEKSNKGKSGDHGRGHDGGDDDEDDDDDEEDDD